MSGHERERLSAYLDGELGPAERAEVEAHLSACPACSASLAELAAAGRAAAGLVAEAPEGYFDALPGRVAARLEGRPSARRRPPAWAWAAAAAALLAVLTPLTLREPAPAPLAAPGSKAAPEVRAGAAGPPAAPEVRQDPAGAPGPSAARAAPAALPAEAPGSSAPAAPPASAREKAATASAAPAPDEAPVRVAADEPAPSLLGVAGETAESFRAPARGARAEAAPAEGTAPSALVVEAPGRAFGELAAERPRSAAQWRLLRERWRALAAAQEGQPGADEARVRAIEAGREAWLASGESADEEAFRRDARAYLEREDAAQRERVGRLLAAAPPGP